MSDDIPECECNICQNKRLQGEIELLREERDEAREAARRLVTVLANGDTDVIARALLEYPWLDGDE